MHNTDKDQLQFENEFRKLKLLAEQGGLIETHDKLNPELEKSFLNYIEAFNKAAETGKTITVAEKLNFPKLPPANQVPEKKLKELLEVIETILYKHSIKVEVLYEVTDLELYRFIIEDLLPYEMNDIDIPGSYSIFTYEDFHPNYEEDLKREGEDIVRSLIKLNTESINHCLEFPIQYKEEKLPLEPFVKRLDHCLLAFTALENPTIKCLHQHIESEKAENNFRAYFSEKEILDIQLIWEFKYGFFYCVGVTLTNAS